MLLTFELQWSNACSTSRPPLVRKTMQPMAKFWDEIQTKVLRVFLLVIHSYLYSFAKDLFFVKLTQPLTVSVKEKGGKPDRKPHPLPYGLRNPYINLKSENSSQDMPRNLNIYEFGFWRNKLIIDDSCRFGDLTSCPEPVSRQAECPS
jgi:hypothetical protein